ncbi:hypothetical protein SAMN04487936_102307 [Halobacillus dabanensis]|uniref:Uncharacterized protein n=1 Tax=Halobacillus dabanensis TaxID=240302 RepID=A0A1I3RKQ0_HALDA|nr:DUF6612 family protein [Halobacillus dabanensis]SFJ47163.1 hypothetical protein SAMN04487936_102307 [Halobacillus dabanensis]
MKKWYTGILIIGGVVTLVALSETTSFGEKLLGSDADKQVEAREEMSEGKEILKQSIEAMTKVNGFRIIGEKMQDNKGNGQTQPLIEVNVLLGEEPKIHSKSSLTGENESNQGIEFYMNGDQMYINTAGQWVMLPNSGGHFDKLKNINDDEIDEMLGGSQVFEMRDNGGSYVISLQDGNMIQDLMPAAGIEETTSGENQTIEIFIEKSTYLMKEIIVDSNSGKIMYTISDINAVEESVFPEVAVEGTIKLLDKTEGNNSVK